MSKYSKKQLYGSDIKCPYCDKTISDDDYYFAKEGNYETECPDCDKKFEIETHVSIDYDTRGSCKYNNEMPHELYEEPQLFSNDKPTGRFHCIKCQREYYDFHLANGQYPKLKEGDYIIVKESK